MKRKLWVLLLILLQVTLYAKTDKDDPYFNYNKETVYVGVDDEGDPYSRTISEMEIEYPSEQSVRSLPYYSISLSSFDELEEIEAYVVDARGRKIKLNEDDLDVSENNDDEYFVTGTKQYKVNFRGLEKGSIVYLKYEVTTYELHYFQPFYFQTYLASRLAEYRIIIPKNVQLKLVKKNFDGHKIQKIEEQKGRGRTELVFRSVGNDAVDYREDGPRISYYAPHILPILEKYGFDGKLENYLTGPEDLYKWYFGLIKSAKNTESKELQSLASSIKSESKNQDDIIRNTYSWVQKNIRYIAYEAGSDGVIPRDPSLVLQRKFGDCKDMSNLIIALLKQNDIKSHYVWVGTRSIPYTYDEVYTMNADNHMIAAVNRNDEWIYLDATDPNGVFGLPTAGVQGKQAMISNDDAEFYLNFIPVLDDTMNRMDYNMDVSLEGENLIIDNTLYASGLISGSIKNSLLYSNGKDKKDMINGMLDVNINKSELLNFEIDESTNNNITIVSKYKVNDHVRKIGEDLIFNPFINRIAPSSKSDLEDRVAPLDLDENRVMTNKINITIPEGYDFGELPDDYVYEGKYFIYKFLTKRKGDVITIYEDFSIQSEDLLVPVSELERWNRTIEDIKNIYKTSIKLTKKS